MMSIKERNILFAIGIVALASLACSHPWFVEEKYYPDPEVMVSGDVLEQWEATATVGAAATRAPRLTVAAEQGQSGICRWRNYEITPPSGSTSNPNMEIDVSHPTSIKTTLKHGVSGCPDQFFHTQHYWRFPEVMHPGESQRLEAGFE